jgi:hypothetical protein
MERKYPKNSEILLAISGTSVIILSWSCAIKWSLSKVLRSSALRKDAITSGAVAAMAATMLVSTTVYKSHPSVWWLDSAVALIVSFILSMLGIKTLTQHPWWKRDFWVDGELPPEEGRAEHIMELPFHGSPRRPAHIHGRGAQRYVADAQVEEAAAGAEAAATVRGDP